MERPLSLDDLVRKQQEYEAKVNACEHDFQRPERDLYPDLGRECTKCKVRELPWLRGRLGASLTFYVVREGHEKGKGGYLAVEDGFQPRAERACLYAHVQIADLVKYLEENGIPCRAVCVTWVENE